MLLNYLSAALFASTTYDYIVVGGGTAGLTVASRLSENSNIKVGVVEAGIWRDDDPRVYQPGMYGKAMGDKELDWVFQTEPQAELNNRKITWNRGKMLGGSSGLNFMFWNRPGREDLDAWGEALGNKGWGWDGLFDYFKKSETIAAPTTSVAIESTAKPPYDPEYHGSSGPINSSFSDYLVTPSDTFLPSLSALGVKLNNDSQGGDNIGGFLSTISVNPTNLTRSDSATAYLEPALDRPNLSVLTGVLATKVLLNGTTATGVQIQDQNGKKYTIKAKREVILSAGSLQSAQLLELSGIGSKKVLQKAGIKVVVQNENVGENLQDHMMVPTTYQFLPGTITRDFLNNATFLKDAQAQYAAKKPGFLSGIDSFIAYLPLSAFMSKSEMAQLAQVEKQNTSPLPSSLRSADNVAQIEVLFMPFGLSPTLALEPGVSYLTMNMVGLHPRSRGASHIKSSNASEYPEIDARIFSNPADKLINLAGVKFANKIAETMPVKQTLARRVEPAPGNTTDDQWWDHVKSVSSSIEHPVGTCSMMPKEKGGVVDTSLRVYGVKGLRVVDASIIPLQLGAHTVSTVYAVAEKAADLIKQSQ